MQDFVEKTSTAPARILGLSDQKGHLGEGADADIAALDFLSGEVRLTVCQGDVVAYQGVSFRKPSRILTTERGAAAVQAAGLDAVIVDVRNSGFYVGH